MLAFVWPSNSQGRGIWSGADDGRTILRPPTAAGPDLPGWTPTSVCTFKPIPSTNGTGIRFGPAEAKFHARCSRIVVEQQRVTRMLSHRQVRPTISVIVGNGG